MSHSGYVEGICDICEQTKLVAGRYRNRTMLCYECFEKEEKIRLAENPPSNTEVVESVPPQSTIGLNRVIKESREINSSIQVRQDIFNAKTISIVELEKAISEDEAIENKPYVLFSELRNQFEHLKKVMFELDEKRVEIATEQKAIQLYFNQHANKLRADEREKLRIQDINYKPSAPKQAKPKPIKTRSSKGFDKNLLHKIAAQTGCDPYTLQMIAVSKHCSIEDAVLIFKKSLADDED